MVEKLHTFTIEHTSKEDKQTYSGVFSSKRLSMMDRSKLSVRKSQLCGGMYTVRDEDGNPTGMGIDSETEFFNYMLAFLEIVLVQKPKWWDLAEITDPDIVTKVFEEAFEWEQSFRSSREAKETKSSGSGEGTGEDKHSSADTGSAPKKVVDGKVQAALDA